MRALFALALLGARVAGQNGENGVWFIYPTEGHTYQHMDTVNVTYESPFPSPTLFGWCDGGRRNFYDQRVPAYNASVAVVLNFTSGTPCWFNLRPGRAAGFGANSPSFNLLGVERPSGGIVHGPDTSGSDPTPSSPSTTSSAITSSSPSAAPTSESTETAVTTAPDPQETTEKYRGDGGGLGGGQSAGIAVGAIVGVLIIGAGLFLWWRKRSRRPGHPDQSHLHEAVHDGHCQHCHPQWQRSTGASTSRGGSPATYVQEYNSPCTCVCAAHGQAPVKMWPAEVSSKNSPSEISTSEQAWTGRPRVEMPA
ncbi:hypothetical protein QBC40DRAFT_25195 [Triangularia verruculosa]|uniref:Uncharacterized protein n=1 Tax=Triangularia verruculosa TaxID=2587418 RepID=A0AAN7AN88_9PEZI|nr:hypothetical protein QBC40DRAFT_25195 [Triangularia verruculosa]